MRTIVKLSFLLLLIFSLFSACEKIPDNNVWDPSTHQNRPDPTLTSVSPADFTYSGEGIINITGTNFSLVASENHIFIKGEEGEILTSSETELMARAPNILDMRAPAIDSVMLTLRVDNAINYASFITDPDTIYSVDSLGVADTSVVIDTVYYYLMPAVINLALESGGFDNFDELSSIACSTNETVYVTSARKIYIVEPDSLKNEIGQLAAIASKAMKLGPGGYFHYVQDNYMFRFGATGTPDSWYAIFPSGEQIMEFDFSESGQIYAAGKLGTIYKVDIDTKTVEAVATYPEFQIKSLRIYEGEIYVAAFKYDTTGTTVEQEGIWKNSINADGTLGNSEQFFDWLAHTANNEININAITLTSTGDILAGASSGAVAITQITSGGEATPFYNNILYTPINKFCWGNSKYLYIIGANDLGNNRVLQVNMLDLESAPYHGRN